MVTKDAASPLRHEGTFSSDGVPIWYADLGSGDPVLLLHGFSVQAERNWLSPGIAQALSSTFRVIAPDLRGHGRSGKPHDPSAYGRAVLEDAVRLLDHLGVESTHVVGYSTGAQVALSMITEFPQRVRRAVLGGGGMLEASGEEYEWYGATAKALTNLRPDETIAERLFPGMDLDEDFKKVVNANDPLALSAFAAGMLRLAHDEAELRANEVPVLLLIGEEDPYRYQAEAARRCGSNMRMVVQAGRGHSTALRDPGFVRAILDFLGGSGTARFPSHGGA